MVNTEADLDRQACEELKDMTRNLENTLSEFLSNEDITYLQNWCFEYAEKKARKMKILRTDSKYCYLQAYVRYEFMSEVIDFTQGFSDGSIEHCSKIARRLTVSNDLDYILDRYY